MKKILKYVILLIVIYLVSQLFTYLLTKPNYQEMKNFDVLIDKPKVMVTESKVSKNKGYIKGTITNNTGEIIKNLKVRFDFYNNQGKFVGTEYREEDIFNSTEIINFDIRYAYKNVDEIKISIVKDN